MRAPKLPTTFTNYSCTVLPIHITNTVRSVLVFIYIQGVCQIRVLKEKSGKAVLEKYDGKIREFS